MGNILTDDELDFIEETIKDQTVDGKGVSGTVDPRGRF